MLPINKTVISMAFGAALALTFSGCSSKNQVNFIGKERVLLKEHKSFKEGKFLKVTAAFENDDDTNVEGMVYQIEWLDSKGILVDQTSWKPLTIVGRQKINVVDMANRQDVTDYRIIISTPNK